MSVVFILCVPVGGAVLRFVSVLYSLMVEKVERLLRGQWSAFNIYVASRCASRGGVSSSRLVFLLVPRLVSRLVHRLVCASCSSVSLLRSVSFVSFRLCVLSRRVSRWGVLCRWRLVLFLRIVSRFVPRVVVRPVPSCRVAFVAGGGSWGTWRRGRREPSCFPCSDWLGGEWGAELMGTRCFVQLVLVRIYGCRGLARGKMASI